MNYLITFIQEVRVIQKQCFVRCVRQCLCSWHVRGRHPGPATQGPCEDVTPVDHKVVAHLSQLYFSSGRWLMEASTLPASSSPRSLLYALCSVKNDPSSCLIYMHKNRRLPHPPVWERWGLLHLGQDFPPFLLAIRIFQEG